MSTTVAACYKLLPVLIVFQEQLHWVQERVSLNLLCLSCTLLVRHRFQWGFCFSGMNPVTLGAWNFLTHLRASKYLFTKNLDAAFFESEWIIVIGTYQGLHWFEGWFTWWLLKEKNSLLSQVPLLWGRQRSVMVSQELLCHYKYFKNEHVVCSTAVTWLKGVLWKTSRLFFSFSEDTWTLKTWKQGQSLFLSKLMSERCLEASFVLFQDEAC